MQASVGRPSPASPPFAGAELAEAVRAMDSPALRRILHAARTAHGTVPTWEHVACPLLHLLGEQWARSGTGVEDEHLLSEALLAVLTSALDAGQSPADPRPVLLAGMPGELHSLPLLALSAALAEHGVCIHNFGAALPADALAAAIHRTAPAAIFLWAQTPPYADLDLLATLPDTAPGTRLLLGGPGWAARTLPPATTLATSLAEAVDRITAPLVRVNGSSRPSK